MSDDEFLDWVASLVVFMNALLDAKEAVPPPPTPMSESREARDHDLSPYFEWCRMLNLNHTVLSDLHESVADHIYARVSEHPERLAGRHNNWWLYFISKYDQLKAERKEMLDDRRVEDFIP